jgi:hypothetical protein
VAFYWVVVSSFFPLLFLFPRVNVFLGFRGCAEAFAKTRGVLLGPFLWLFIFRISPPPMGDLVFRWVDFTDAFGEWRAQLYLGFFVAFYWAVLRNSLPLSLE